MKSNFKDIEHPDITSAGQTGRPCPPPYRLKVELSTEIQRAYIKDHEEDFLDWCFADPDVIRRYLEDTEPRLSGWVREVLAG